MTRARRHYTQREAARLSARVRELEEVLENQRRDWVKEYPNGVHIDTLDNIGAPEMAAIRTARKLGHATVIVPDHQATSLHVYALPLAGGPR